MNPLSGNNGGHYFFMNCAITSITANYIKFKVVVDGGYISHSGNVSWQVIEFY